MDAAVRKYSPEQATIILMRPQTGEILAMANRPTFNLNERADAKEECKNRAIADMMEPGSTFKIVAAAAALNENKVKPDTEIFCENGVWNYGGKPSPRSQASSASSACRISSSNRATSEQPSLRSASVIRNFTNTSADSDSATAQVSNCPAKSPAVFAAPRAWTKISITRIPMGHEIGVTPLQMTVAMCAIANGGKLITPRIVKSITTRDGKTVSMFSPTVSRQVISPQTAQQVGNALRGVVSDGGTAPG